MSRLAQSFATLGVILFTILIVVYSREISQFIVGLFVKPDTTQNMRHSVNKETRIRVGTLSNGQTTKEILNLEEIAVDPGQAWKVTTFTGWEIELQENTKAIVELYRPEVGNSSAALLTIISGEYKLLKQGEAGKLFIMQNKKIFSPQMVQSEKTHTIELNKNDPNEPVAELTEDVRAHTGSLRVSKNMRSPMPDKIPNSSDGETLSNEYIEQVITGQANALRNCQLNSVRENKSSQGKLVLAFSIMPNGKIENLKVAKDELKNPSLASCAASVIERTQFKAFAGDPIVFSYPIEFR